jgi:hypothetical protein
MKRSKVYIFIVLLVSVLLVFSHSSNAREIIKCKDKSGSIVFTQNTSDCESHIENSPTVLASKSKVDKTKVSYRFPTRSYISDKGKWNIYVEEGMREGDQDLYATSLAKLNETLDYVFSVMPENARNELSKLRVFLLWGEASPLGGRKSGMSYIRKGEPKNYTYLDPRWEHALIIYSAENLMYLNELWSRKAIFHELSHAWHILNWPEKYPPIFNSWKNAKNSQKFVEVQDIKGKTIKSAYAIKNQLEYFAELSAMYFVGSNYYPYNKAGLRQYDPKGYEMIEVLWN